jgi:iron complex outermembrane receptor protein
MKSSRARCSSAALLLSAALAFFPGTAEAQQPCAATASTQAWPAPLNRQIPVRARDISLRDALDRVAAAGRFRVSYSADFVPLDRRVCVIADSISAGDALAALLRGANVSPIVSAPDHVVIAPTRQLPLAQRESVQTLERVVVTGSAVSNAQRPLSVALDVIDRKQLAHHGTGSLASAFDGNVAGLWMWEQSPSNILARYGSIRGASSFGLSYPKVYIDGIEMANPLLVTALNPASLDRVEVIRGPQGAALYGAEAISGVVNIVTRQEGLQPGDSRTEVVSLAGPSQTSFAARSALAQNHSLNWRTGSNVRSGSFGANVTTLGGYVPNAYSRDLKLNGGFRAVTSAAAISATARVYAKEASIGENPLIAAYLPSSAPIGPGAQLSSVEPPQTVGQYTVGLSATLLKSSQWVPSVSAGIDGYRLSNVANEFGLLPSALDSALQSAAGGAHRITLRGSAVRHYEIAEDRSLAVTFSGEHSRLRESLVVDDVDAAGSSRDSTSGRSNSGLVAQATYAIQNAVFLTGGLRLEQNRGVGFDDDPMFLPMMGVAAVREIGGLTLKARGAYGVGARAARTTARGALRHGVWERSLEPEQQTGAEFGADLFYSRIALHVTRFDQRASGLIQPVAVPRDSLTSVSGPTKRVAYPLQNVGEITNRGWEFESSVDLGNFAVGGAVTTVDSRVQHTASSYTGDLRPGDRMLGVPAGTAALTASWLWYGWRAGVTATRAFDWVNYDRLRLARDYASCDSCTADATTGAELRSYWMRYDGVTRLRASLARDLSPGLGLRFTADNLTNAQRGEPDNITLLPGRTLLFGVSAKIR